MTTTHPTLLQPALPAVAKQLIRESKVLDKYLFALGRHSAQATAAGRGPVVEQVHQLRVHTRRLRTLLHTVRDELPGKTYKLRKKYRRAIKVTNALRDQHVLLARLRNWQQHSSADIALACRWLRQRVQQQEVTNPAVNQSWLEHYQHLNQRLRQRLQTLLDAPDTSLSTAQLLHRQLEQLQHDLRDRFADCEQGKAESLHKLRITIKKLRYALTPWRQQLNAYKPLLKTLKYTQNMLGDIHDNQVQQDWLHPLIPELARDFYAGQLSRIESNPQQALRIAAAAHDIPPDPGTTSATPDSTTPPAGGGHQSPMPGLLSLVACLQQEHHLMATTIHPILEDKLRQPLFTALEQLIVTLDSDQPINN